MKPKYVIQDRAKFVEERYANYKRKRAYLDQIDPKRQVYHLTDLDMTFTGFDKPMKDVVLCDSCNEDITDPYFVFVEGQMTYHRDCANGRDWYDDRLWQSTIERGMKPPKRYDVPDTLPDNVIPIFRKRDLI